MRIKHYPLFFFLLAVSLFFLSSTPWGFFGHRRINRMAVFTLDAQMMPFFRKHIEYLTEHAVDPDKRRYATRHEAVRHYIDIDHWGSYPFSNVPRDWTEALMAFTDWNLLNAQGDTLRYVPEWVPDSDKIRLCAPTDTVELSKANYRQWFFETVQSQYYEDEWIIPIQDWQLLTQRDTVGLRLIQFEDHFSEYGILPYHLLVMQRRLTGAFRNMDAQSILRLSAEMGHYIGDAHVPLHTTENYNGQLTNQIGIHAFWESRLPELFADAEYDFFVGRATYIDSPKDYFWETVLTSHLLVDSVLQLEQHLRDSYPADQQFCFEERFDRTVRTQCQEYAAAYREALDGMVERRMRQAIQAIGSSWYTAWVDAGQPDLRRLIRQSKDDLIVTDADQEIETYYKRGNAQGRRHEGEE